MVLRGSAETILDKMRNKRILKTTNITGKGTERQHSGETQHQEIHVLRHTELLEQKHGDVYKRQQLKTASEVVSGIQLPVQK